MGLKDFWQYIITDTSKKNSSKKTPSKKSTIIKKSATKKEISPSIDIHKSTGKRKLSKTVILFILINSILGSSLFYLPGQGVISSGAASIIAWIAVFIIATLMMLYVGELITLHPTSGGTYEFCKRAYGRTVSFFSGWLIWIAGNFGMALAVVAAAEYFIPTTYAHYFILRLVFAGIWILVLNYLALRGIDAGSTMLVVFGIIATVVVVAMTLPSFISVPGLFTGNMVSPFNLEMMQPFFRHEGTTIMSFLFLSILLISEAFFGFEVVSYMANEVQEPKKLHRVLITGMIISGVIMSLYVFSSLGTVAYHDYVNDARPFALQALNTMGPIGQNFVVFGMYLVIIGAAAAWPITGSRLIRAMAGDKLFVKSFAELHPKYLSPYKAVYFQTIVVALFSWFIFRGYIVEWGDPYRTIYLIYVLISFVVLSLVLLAVPILRKKEAHLERPFKAPFGRVVPILFVFGILFLVANWIRIEGSVAISVLMLTVSFIILGVPFYFLVEMFYNPNAIIKVNEKLSYFVVFGEKLFFPFSIRNKLIKDLKKLKGKTVLEYGCSVGTLTKKLAPLVGPTGRIYATDLSLHKVMVANKRTKRIKHVTVHHHPDLNDFKLNFPKKVENVISVGMLSYMQNPERILKSLAKRVKKNADIVFLDYDKFFYFIPNVSWIKNDKKLIKLFANSGFKVKVERKRGLLWQYIIINGKKV
jgi:basic amino acid/polyamine antiporter, APA family